jgi:hypothetical protein
VRVGEGTVGSEAVGNGIVGRVTRRSGLSVRAASVGAADAGIREVGS